jgi:hypothetical protein
MNANLRRKEDHPTPIRTRRKDSNNPTSLNLWNLTPPLSKAGDPMTLRRRDSLRNVFVSTATSPATWPGTTDNQRKGMVGKGLVSN